MISIVSLAWNQYDVTESFLKRLRAWTDIPHKLIFTDNGSTEPIPELVRKYYPNAKLIIKKENVGCPATRNEAMKYVDTDICFWLDNDTMVGKNWYKPIIRALKNETVGISTNTANYTVKRPWQQPYPFEPVNEGDCDWFMGWLVGFKTKAYKPINNYKIPVNLDDVELALGIKENGYRAIISEPVFAQHLGSVTGRGWEFDDQEKLSEFWNNWKDKTHILERWK